MTLTEALKEGIYVRRRTWPWWKCLNDVKRESNRVWAIEESSVFNGWRKEIPWADAIADDWEAIKEIP